MSKFGGVENTDYKTSFSDNRSIQDVKKDGEVPNSTEKGDVDAPPDDVEKYDVDELPDDVIESKEEGELPDDVVEDVDNVLPDDVVDNDDDNELPDDVEDDNEEDAPPDDDLEDDRPDGQIGGSYRDVKRNSDGEHHEVHHMPADSSSNLDRDLGPAIRMDKEDHRQTASCGNSREAREYREKQKELIEKGNFREALQMDIDEIHEKFGDKYDDAIDQMLDYVGQLEQEGKINE